MHVEAFFSPPPAAAAAAAAKDFYVLHNSDLSMRAKGTAIIPLFS